MNTAAAEKTLNSISPSSAGAATGGGGHWSVKRTVQPSFFLFDTTLGQTKWIGAVWTMAMATERLWSAPFAGSFAGSY